MDGFYFWLEQGHCFQPSTPASLTPIAHTVTPLTPADDLQLNVSLWQDGLTTEELLNLADSIDINSFDFMTGFSS